MAELESMRTMSPNEASAKERYATRSSPMEALMSLTVNISEPEKDAFIPGMLKAALLSTSPLSRYAVALIPEDSAKIPL